MGVYIKGMEMPKDCIVCPFGWNGCNKQHDFVYMGSRPDNCPLVPVPPHGRLIDANALVKEVEDIAKELPSDSIGAERFKLFAEFITEMPTVIPATSKGG